MYYVFMTKKSEVAERIEELLRIKNMTVADLSRMSGVSESALSNILSGVRKQPKSDTVQKIARGFPTSTSYLSGETNDVLFSAQPIELLV
jgi:transcriptional regulator with XRE-family HTH domain